MGDVYTLLCLRSAQLSNAFGLRNLCCSKIYICSDAPRVQDCWNLVKGPVRTKNNMPCAQMLHIYIASVIRAFNS